MIWSFFGSSALCVIQFQKEVARAWKRNTINGKRSRHHAPFLHQSIIVQSSQWYIEAFGSPFAVLALVLL
jgi:hypothetical protein